MALFLQVTSLLDAWISLYFYMNSNPSVTVGYLHASGRVAFVLPIIDVTPNYDTDTQTITLVKSTSIKIQQSILFTGLVPVAKLSKYCASDTLCVHCEKTNFYYSPPLRDQTLGFCKSTFLNSVQ
jgi:hypothetical protein